MCNVRRSWRRHRTILPMHVGTNKGRHGPSLRALTALLALAVAGAAAAQAPADAPTPKQASATLYYDADPKKAVPERVTLSRGDKLTVHSACSGLDVRFDEVRRKTRIRDDLTTLLDAVRPLSESCTLPASYAHTLRFTRSTLTITAKRGNGETATHTVITGPKEHFYLGLDLPVNSKRTLKYDQDSEALVPREHDPSFHLSFNFQYQDVLGRLENDWPVGISIKAMALVSDHPLDSVGVGVGLRSRGLAPASFDFLDSLGLFAGVFWVKEDGIEDGSPIANGKTRRLFRFGVSYDLSTAMKWASF